MKTNILGMLLMSLAGLMLLRALPTALAAGDKPGEAVFPFVLPWDDASPGATDLSGWLQRPSGKLGQVQVSTDGHFQAGGKRVRFLGVNLSFAAGMPEKEDADKVAGRLAKFGINVCRFHHMDTGQWPNGLRARGAKLSGALDAEARERMDYFIARLKEHGIYANINLLVGRPFNAADGQPAEIEKLDWKDRHLVGFFNPGQLALQKEYARELLAHRNPFTGLAYTEDPAVAFVEINNEQGLVHSWLGGQLDGLPDIFLADLRREWNQWLARRYGRVEKLRGAWKTGEQPLGAEMLAGTDFQQGPGSWNLEQHNGARASARAAEKHPEDHSIPSSHVKALRLEVQQPGRESWHVQLGQSGLKVEAERSYTLSFWARSVEPQFISAGASQAHEPWNSLGFSASPRLTRQWQQFHYVFTATQTDDRARVVFGNFGQAGSTVWLFAPTLRPGGVTGLKENESPAAGSVPLFSKSSYGERTSTAQTDWMRFLEATEDNYWQAMHRFLKQDLKVRALVTGTIVGCSPPNLMARMDWVDTHAYWQHPHFPRRPWDDGDWIVNNRTMVNERGGTLPGLALKRVWGKPHACTEYNHPAPNTYSSEGFLLLAAYAALQDWDAIYAYSYAHTRSQGWDLKRINGFFDIDQHPTKMATLIPAAAMFLRGDIAPARELIAADLSLDLESSLLRRASAWNLVDAGTVGISRENSLKHRVALLTEGLPRPAKSKSPQPSESKENRLVSDTGELTWDLTESGRGVVTVNTPRSKAVIGFGAGKSYPLGKVTIQPNMGLQDGWSAITLSDLDGRGRWLVTATGYADNTGLEWHNSEKSTVGRDWGQPPSRVEGVSARLHFAKPPGQVEAWALDERGQRRKKLPLAAAAGGGTQIEIGPAWRTLWYEVTLR